MSSEPLVAVGTEAVRQIVQIATLVQFTLCFLVLLSNF